MVLLFCVYSRIDLGLLRCCDCPNESAKKNEGETIKPAISSIPAPKAKLHFTAMYHRL
jgi:hypothetical protein